MCRCIDGEFNGGLCLISLLRPCEANGNEKELAKTLSCTRSRSVLTVYLGPVSDICDELIIIQQVNFLVILVSVSAAILLRV